MTMCYNSIAQKTQPAFYSGVYRNVFAEAGYSKKDIDAKVDELIMIYLMARTRFILKWAIRWDMFLM